MELTSFISKIVGPVLLLRALSILIDREHFVDMLRGLEREVTTVSFSMFPIALLMTCIGLAVVHSDTSSIAALMIHVIAWGGILKASALILVPSLVSAKAQVLERMVPEPRACRMLRCRRVLHVVRVFRDVTLVASTNGPPCQCHPREIDT